MGGPCFVVQLLNNYKNYLYHPQLSQYYAHIIRKEIVVMLNLVALWQK